MVIRFNKDAYLKDLGYSIYQTVIDLSEELNARVISNILNIEFSEPDRKQGFTAEGFISDLYKVIQPRSLKQVLSYGGRVVGGVKISGGSKSIVALFYEYGTGSKSQMPSGRWSHLSPNPARKGSHIVSRPLKKPRPKGVKVNDWFEEYPVIKGARGAILKHKTKGLKSGHLLPEYEVKAHFFMRDALEGMKPMIIKELRQAVVGINPKFYFQFKDVRIR